MTARHVGPNLGNQPVGRLRVDLRDRTAATTTRAITITHRGLWENARTADVLELIRSEWIRRMGRTNA